jgi:hypothetical protein
MIAKSNYYYRRIKQAIRIVKQITKKEKQNCEVSLINKMESKHI